MNSFDTGAEIVKYVKVPKKECYTCECGYQQYQWSAFNKHQKACKRNK